jgi:carboxypeptidase PM20D1
MKRGLSLALWLIVLLIAVILVKTLLFRSVQSEAFPAEIKGFGDTTLNHFAEAVRYRTISYSSDSPIDTVEFDNYLSFIKRAYPLVTSTLELEMFNRFTMLFRWKGENASLKPLVLMAHYDVVPPGDTTAWTKGPFSGESDGTYIWGRGTLDDKAAMISILEAVERLISEGFKPDRTILLSFGHDEELGGRRGALSVSTALRDRGITAEYVLDEGMAVTIGMVPMMKKPVALIGTSEKGYISVKLSAEMPGGHSSTPAHESAVTLIADAISSLNRNQMKPRISGPVDDFIKYVGPEMPFYAKVIFANKWLFKGLLLGIYSGSSSGNALVRTTAAPTMMNAGVKDNIIPTKAEAVINFRILPGETSDDVLRHISEVADKKIRIEVLSDFISEPAPVSPAGSTGFRYIFTTLRQIYPEAVISPTMMLGASDSKHFLLITSNIYRFAPIVVRSEDMERVHGLNERAKIEDFLKGVTFYYKLLKNSQLVLENSGE